MENPQTLGLPGSAVPFMRISPIHLKILAYTLDIEGYDSSTALKQCGFESNDAIDEAGEWVTVEQFDRMMAAAIEATKDRSFGLVAGKSLALMRSGILTALAVSTSSLRQMLSDIHRFAPLSVPQSEVELMETRQGTRLVVQAVVKGGLSGHFRTEFAATTAVQMLRFVGASSTDIYHATFPYPQPPGQELRYAATFGQRISFEQSECAITFNPALLDVKLPTHDPVAYMAARTRAESLLAAMKAGSDMADKVRAWLLSALPALPTVADTAAHLGMSERTFRRHLFTLGTTHADLTQECQRLMAERLLAEGKLPLKQIAQSLGFSSVHGFHRAFRRWSGLTPSAWREKQCLHSPLLDDVA